MNNRKVIDYCTVYRNTIKELDEQVNAGLKNGYELHGHRTTILGDSKMMHYQTMIKYDDVEITETNNGRAIRV